jgi:uncharacterized protein YjiS (DUF1127 family)
MKHASNFTANPPAPVATDVPGLEDLTGASRIKFVWPHPIQLLMIWYGRARFRAKLIADLRDRPDYLRDIGIHGRQAQLEATRFFWEPILLKRLDQAAHPEHPRPMTMPKELP